MPTYTAETSFPHSSIIDIYNYMSSPGLSWPPNHPQSIEVNSGDGEKIGDAIVYNVNLFSPLTKFDAFFETTRSGPATQRWLWQILVAQPGENFTFQGCTLNSPIDLWAEVSYEFSYLIPKGLVTIKRIMKIEPRSFLAKILFPFFASSIEKAGQDYLDNIKGYLRQSAV